MEPGPLHAGPYQTRYYFGGQLLVQIPDDSWVSGEDSTGEFDLHTVRQSALEFWMNIYPVQGPPDVERDPGYDGTATGLVDWVAANPNVKVVERRPGTLAGMPAEVIEFERAPDAVNDDPGCPQEFQPCVTLFGFEQWDGFFGSAGPFVNRLYAADLTWGGSSHVVSAMIWADTRTDFEAFVGDAATIIEGAKLPAGVTPG